jgi:hypothetical protein
VIQKIENEDECPDIEKKERSVGPKFQSPLEVLAIERIERSTADGRTDARGGWKPMMIRSGGIEGHLRNEKVLR